MLTKEKREEIRKKAKEIRGEYSITEFPAKLSKILIGEDIGLYESGQLDKYNVSGYIEKNSQDIKIVVNKNHADTRNIFTVAHELGHYFLGHLDGEERIISYRGHIGNEDRIVELEADLFAAELLMPKDEVLKTLINANCESHDEKVSELAKKFGVSRAAIEYRLRDLNRD